MLHLQNQDVSIQKRDQKELIQKTADHVRKKLEGEGSGHDWWHVYRVWCLAQEIAKKEQADLFVVELAALLHDIADWKFHDGDDSVGPRVAAEFLQTLYIEQSIIDHVCRIIKDVSFKGAGVATPMKTIEGMIVQDADRLDAIGAIGVARCFAYGGYKGNEMYNPEQSVVMHQSSEDYKKKQSSSVNHFYEKLFLLKDRMNTTAARKVANERHQYMQQFIDRFKKEWDGIL